MSGVAWSVVAGVAFGLFQAVNRASLVTMDVLRSTFLQLLVSAVVVLGMVAASGDLARLLALPAAAWLDFALAGLLHFLAGWTLLNHSQKVLGAARTSPLLATTPLFGTALAMVALSEVPGALGIAGMLTIVGGVYLVELDRLRRAAPGAAPGARDPGRGAALYGLGAALAWAVSPVFIKRGLARADAPILGVAIGLLAATAAYGAFLLLRSAKARRARTGTRAPVPRREVALKVVAGVLVGLATWTRWYALSLADVAVVLSLGLLSVPTVIVLAPLLVGRQLERVTPPVVLGSALVVAGALVLIVPVA